MTRHVAAGATLVVTQVDELFPAVRRLAEACEKSFHVYTFVNLYAGWRSDNGFDVHWDRHDTLILQVRGRKDWKVWTATRPHPIQGDTVPSPTAEPFWHGTLEDGDVLYMPRGWWHVAYPRDEPSLHLTIGLPHPTGIDLLGWVLERLRERVDVRMDVPHWKGADEQEAWIRSLAAAWAADIGDNVIERYMASVAALAHSRPIVCLPETSRTTEAHMPNDHSLLRLAVGRQLQLERKDGTNALFFKAQGREWRCDEALAPALTLLNHIEPHTVAEMRQVVDHRVQSLLHPFIVSLVMAGVVWAVEPSARSDVAAPPQKASSV